jgi:hypothetical protein
MLMAYLVRIEDLLTLLTDPMVEPNIIINFLVESYLIV